MKIHERLAKLICGKLDGTTDEILTAYNLFLIENTNPTLLVRKYYENSDKIVQSLISAIQSGDKEAKFPLIDRLTEIGVMSFDNIVTWGYLYYNDDNFDVGCIGCGNETCNCVIPVQNIQLDLLKEAIIDENLERCQFCNCWLDAWGLIDDENNVVGCYVCREKEAKQPLLIN